MSDFWGAEKEHPSFNSSEGASAIVILTEKGESLLKEIKIQMEYEESEWRKIINHNDSLIKSADQNKIERNLNISNAIPRKNFVMLLKVYTPEKIKKILKSI